MSTFETKDSGVRSEYASGMVRDTQDGKPRWDLLFAKDIPYAAQFFTRVAELLARGAEKYDPRNWEKADSVEEVERMAGSGLRHHMQHLAGMTDEDHAAATVVNLFFEESTKWKLANKEEPDAQADEEGSSGLENSGSGDPGERPSWTGVTGPGPEGTAASSWYVPGSGPVMESGSYVQPRIYGWCSRSTCTGRATSLDSRGFYHCDRHRSRSY